MFFRALWADARISLLVQLLCLFLTVSSSLYYTEWMPASTRAGEVRDTGKTDRPVIDLVFHGDLRFTPGQRRAIEAAAEDVNRTSCGFVKARVVWDVRSFAFHALQGENLIMSSTNEELMKWQGPKGEYLLGSTLNVGFKWIFLVTPKLEDDLELFEWVTAHEMTHAGGMMNHDRDGLMEPEAPMVVLDKPEWSYQDVVLFCQRWRCEPKMFLDCRYR
jgi:hypothetical protein